MIKNLKKAILCTVSSLIFAVPANALVITVDPGHGGNNRGATYYYDRNFKMVPINTENEPFDPLKYKGVKEILEKEINLKISKFLREELRKYKDESGKPVDVYLTRENDKEMSLSERIDIGANNGSDLIISIHNNATESHTSSGTFAIVTNSNYNNLYNIEEKIAESILNTISEKFDISRKKSFADSILEGNASVDDLLDYALKNDLLIKNEQLKQMVIKSGILEEHGILNSDDNISRLKDDLKRRILENGYYKNGLLRRIADDGCTYDNGDTSDWYGIVRWGALKGVPSIILECCHIDNVEEYKKMLSADSKLKELAKTIALGIANYFKLTLSK